MIKTFLYKHCNATYYDYCTVGPISGAAEPLVQSAIVGAECRRIDADRRHVAQAQVSQTNNVLPLFVFSQYGYSINTILKTSDHDKVVHERLRFY